MVRAASNPLAPLLLGLVGAISLAPRGARAGEVDKVRCAASYEQAQVLRRAEDLEAARNELLVCQAACPSAVQQECARWLEEIGALVPTVRFIARDANGALLTGVGVFEQGTKVASVGDDAVKVAAGKHVFRFEREGSPPVEVRAEIHVGEREHPVVVTMASASGGSEGATGPKPASRTPYFVAAGVAGAALLAAGALAIKGHVDRGELRSTCAGHCASADVDAIRTTWWTAAGLATAGALALTVTVMLWPRSYDGSRGNVARAVAFDVSPRGLSLLVALP